MRAAVLVAGLVALTLVACTPAIPPQQNYATVSGIVYDGTTGQPLVGASVTIDSVLTTTTGSDGTFMIANVPIGPYSVIYAAQGFVQHQDQGSVAAGDKLQLSVSLYK